MTPAAVRGVTAVWLAAIVLSGCAPSDTTAASGDCQEPAPQQVQDGGHLLGDAQPPVPYSSVPPTSGWHSSGRGPAPGAYAEPLTEPAQVKWLELGGIVVAYDPALPDEVVGELNRLAGEVERIVVTPYETAMPAPIALTAWGVLQRCEAVTIDAVVAFRDAHADQVADH